MIDALLRRELVEAAIEALPLIVIDLDTGTVLHATQPAEEMLGYGVRGELVGKSVGVLAPPAGRPALVSRARAYAENPARVALGSTSRATVLGCRGEPVTVEFALTPVKLTDRRCVVAVALPVGAPRGEVQ